jgi:hypothetical protein
MKHGLKNVFGFAAGTLLALGAGSASAQTTANGPYFATPSWDQTLPASTRFIVLSNMNSDAVLDRETGVCLGEITEPICDRLGGCLGPLHI